MYLAHHCMILSFLYKKRLPAPLNEYVNFVDMVSPLRKLGEQYYVLHMGKQWEQLQELLNSAHGMGDTHQIVRFEEVQAAFNQILHIFSRLKSIWKDIIPPDIYFKAMGTLVDAIVVEIIDQVEKLKDISEDETHQLYSLLCSLSKCDELFTNIYRQAKKKSKSTSDYVPHWDKLMNLKDLLELNMAGIMERYNTGKLKDFTAAELKGLIKALFADTPLRRKNLELIK